MTVNYDPSTDSLYIKVQPGESVGNRRIGEDIILDLGTDGETVGYDIQNASKHPEMIGEALRLLQRHYSA